MNGDLINKFRINEFVCIERAFGRIKRIDGFIRQLSEELMIVEPYNDFYSYGFTILKHKDIVDIRHSDHDIFIEMMIKNEGLDVEYKLIVPISNFEESLSFFNSTQQIIIIEIEYANNDEANEFYIGKVLKIENGKVIFRYFDALGKWDKEEDEIDIEEITCLQFDTPYINVFSKYLSDY